MKKYCQKLRLLGLAMCCSALALGQEDSVQVRSLDSFILHQRGIIGSLAKNLLSRQQPEGGFNRQRNDEPFMSFRGRFIRQVRVHPLDFGVSLFDTSVRQVNRLTRFQDPLHNTTNEKVVRKNLFFSVGDSLVPELLGASERHLRDLSFLQDARIVVQPVEHAEDSVDIIVLTKDGFSLGGGASVSKLNRMEAGVQEDNLGGRGDRFRVGGFYDGERQNPMGYRVEYVMRNVSGSFIDVYLGFQDYNKSFSSRKYDERDTYLRLLKPLVNPFMKWTYALEVGVKSTDNMYFGDSVYKADYQYRYNLLDIWGGRNLTTHLPASRSGKDRLNLLVGGRLLQRKFEHRPLQAGSRDFFRYMDRTAALGAISIFRQTFFKTQFIYGFGRNEDVPEGIDASLVGGWTQMAGRSRPYLGFDLQRYFFTRSDNYFLYTLKGGGYLHGKKPEDVSLLLGVDLIGRLQLLGRKWKQRTFLAGSAARQIAHQLDEPLLLESPYGLLRFDNRGLGGHTRYSLKGESVFFSPWKLVYFKLAPFAFGAASYFYSRSETSGQPTLYSAVGGGMRFLNESLVFGTMEIRGMYHPLPDFSDRRWRVEVGTNIRFRYNRQFIKRPELVSIN